MISKKDFLKTWKPLNAALQRSLDENFSKDLYRALNDLDEKLVEASRTAGATSLDFPINPTFSSTSAQRMAQDLRSIVSELGYMVVSHSVGTSFWLEIYWDK